MYPGTERAVFVRRHNSTIDICTTYNKSLAKGGQQSEGGQAIR